MLFRYSLSENYFNVINVIRAIFIKNIEKNKEQIYYVQGIWMFFFVLPIFKYIYVIQIIPNVLSNNNRVFSRVKFHAPNISNGFQTVLGLCRPTPLNCSPTQLSHKICKSTYHKLSTHQTRVALDWTRKYAQTHKGRQDTRTQRNKTSQFWTLHKQAEHYGDDRITLCYTIHTPHMPTYPSLEIFAQEFDLGCWAAAAAALRHVSLCLILTGYHSRRQRSRLCCGIGLCVRCERCEFVAVYISVCSVRVYALKTQPTRLSPRQPLPRHCPKNRMRSLWCAHNIMLVYLLVKHNSSSSIGV